MRGKVDCRLSAVLQFGITPAYAGKRWFCSFLLGTLRDHPRICGEKRGRFARRGSRLGSPPHMRGKAQYELARHEATGITPAYAGKSGAPGSQMIHFGDHPRICGEKRRDYCILSRWGGITPAYAGKRWIDCVRCRNPRDHPRICGEKYQLFRTGYATVGSPPHMRGKAQRGSVALWRSGITPAYAGKSFTHPAAGASHPDHPRICGEKTKKIP